jgi:AcrR family transcriptional regulator
MLDAALNMVNRTGLTVSLDHISFEDVIRDAGVARSAVYRRWPYKDLFFADLLRELAAAAAPAAAVNDETGREMLLKVLRDHRDDLAKAPDQGRLVSEMMRLAAAHDFEAVHDSIEWRTYLALHATFSSLPDGELREEIQAALARSERGFIDRLAHGWERIATALGYRLRPETGGGYETIAALVSATMRGLVIMALSNPALVTRRIKADPRGVGESADWSLIGLNAACIANTFFEPDPGVAWNDDRLAALFKLLHADLADEDSAAGTGGRRAVPS